LICSSKFDREKKILISHKNNMDRNVNNEINTSLPIVEQNNNNNNFNKRDLSWLLPVIVIIIIILVLWGWKKWSRNTDTDSTNNKEKEKEKENKDDSGNGDNNNKKNNSNQNEFIITDSLKTKNHPNLTKGSMMGYKINGIENATLNLHRNKSYKFTYAGSNNLPLYFTTSEIGNDIKLKIPNSIIFDKPKSEIITFTKDYPNKFYYQCLQDEYVGGVIHLY
jgi:hypothetical protein